MRAQVRKLKEQLEHDLEYAKAMGLAKDQQEKDRLYYIGMVENLKSVIELLKEILGENK